VLLLHGLGNSSRIFSLDTVDTNLVEYLTAAGYDVWLLDSRASSELAAAEFDGDTLARCDYPAAVRTVREATGAAAVDVVAHGFGAVTAAAALLAGMEGVRSLLCAQAALHLDVPATARVKAGLHIPALLDALGVDHLTAYTDQRAGWLDELFNASLRLRPLAADERCRSPVCHRITFIYGLAYEHDRLNAATHDTLHELFGTTSVRALEHLARIVRSGHLVDAEGNDRYLPHLQRLVLPVTLLHGSDNATLLPEGTRRSLALLSEHNGAALYRRHVLPGYGHLDCLIGKEAARDVFPLIAAHLARASAPA
jgi:cholesterol oxidase